MALLPALTAEELEQQLDSHRRRGARFVGILLTDGSTVLADNRQNMTSLAGRCMLRLRWVKAREVSDVDIPISSVAGTFRFNAPLGLGEYRTRTHGLRGWPDEPMFNILSATAVSHAVAHGFTVGSHPLRRITPPPPKGIIAGALDWAHSEVLYYDNGYLLSAGGLTAGSVSIPPGLGFGIEGAAGLRRKALRRLRTHPTPLTRVCSKRRTAVAEGFVDFIDLGQVTEAERSRLEIRIDDGKPFVPALLREGRGTAYTKFVLVYFRDIWGPVPTPHLEAWDRIVPPVRVFGEVQHRTFRTEDWDVDCAILVRCAGVIKRR